MSPALSLDRIFIGYAIVLGIAVGVVTVLVPASQSAGLSPYLWVLAGVGVFEVVAMYLRGFDKGPPITMGYRIAGFVVGVGIMVAIRLYSGVA